MAGAVVIIDSVLAPVSVAVSDLDLAFPQGMERMSDANVFSHTCCARCIW
jgi:hypothetical protein